MAARLTSKQRLDRAVREHDLMQNFIDAAVLLGWRTMHIADSRRMVRQGGQTALVGDSGCKGWPDVFLAHRRTGRLLAVEVKKELEHPTPEQQEWLDDLAACGVETFVLRPSGWDVAVSRLRVPVAA